MRIVQRARGPALIPPHFGDRLKIAGTHGAEEGLDGGTRRRRATRRRVRAGRLQHRAGGRQDRFRSAQLDLRRRPFLQQAARCHRSLGPGEFGHLVERHTQPAAALYDAAGGSLYYCLGSHGNFAEGVMLDNDGDVPCTLRSERRGQKSGRYSNNG